MTYYDQAKNEKYVPYCIEPSVGADRVTLAFLCDAYNEEEVGEGDVRTVLKFHPALAPIKAASCSAPEQKAERTGDRGLCGTGEGIQLRL